MSLDIHSHNLDAFRQQSYGARAEQDSATSLRGLENIKELGREDQAAALKKVAKQFESMFISQLLKSMRQSNEAFSEDSMFNSSETRFHRDMYDQQLTLELSNGRGLGLSDQLYRQLLRQYDVQDAQAPTDNKPVDSLERPLSKKSTVLSPSAVDHGKFSIGAPADRNPKETALTNREISLDASSPQGFIQSLKPMAEKYARQLNLSADVLISQAALETGWGKYILNDQKGSSHNLFNIKAKSDWSGDTVNKNTLEYRDGIAFKEQAKFKRYDSLEHSFSDYVDLIKNNPRYQQALDHQGDAAIYLDRIQQAGYATDPNYASKIGVILSRHFST